jgi:predicted NAD/FAD-binding protein/CRP-like cAMP-binding protein
VIGGGAAGIGAAWGLTKAGCKVTLFERESHLGGYCASAPVPLASGQSILVDAGLGDFNRATFVNLGALFDELGLKSRPINQDASYMRCDGSAVWYTSAEQMNFVEPVLQKSRFQEEIARFSGECVEVLEHPRFRDFTLAAYVHERGYSEEFRELYLYPRAQGSFPLAGGAPENYPIRSLVSLWRVHGMIGSAPAARHALDGGMHTYPAAFAAWLARRGGELLLCTRVVALARQPGNVRLQFVDAHGRRQASVFDHAVVAVPSEQVVALLEDGDEEEKQAFEGLLWQRTRIVVHQDASLMPHLRQVWGAYNYIVAEPGAGAGCSSMTFYPNKLNGLPADVPDIFVSVNPIREPDRSGIILDRFLVHPVAGPGTDLACARIEQMQGRRNTWFCGSYLSRPWAHEQALASGLKAADCLRHRLLIQRRPEESRHVDELLRTIPLFDGLDSSALADVQMAASIFSAESGKVLFRQNDRSDGFYLISRGRVRVSTRVPGDEMVDLIEVGPGNILGEFCLLDGGRRSATVRAAEATSGFFVSLSRFESLRREGRPSALAVLDRIRIEVARRARSVAAAIGAEPVPDGAATSRPMSDGGGNSPRPDCACARPDGLEDLLLGLRTFAEFSRDELAVLLAMCDRLDAPRGALLCDFAAKPEFLLIVLRGALRASIRRDGRLEQLLIYGPGDLAGSVPLIDGGAALAQIEARENTLALRMERRNFEALRRSQAEVGSKFFDQVNMQLARDLRRLNRHLGLLRAIRRFNEPDKVSHV